MVVPSLTVIVHIRFSPFSSLGDVEVGAPALDATCPLVQDQRIAFCLLINKVCVSVLWSPRRVNKTDDSSWIVGNSETDLSLFCEFNQRDPTTRKAPFEQIHDRDRESCSSQRQRGENVAWDSGLCARGETERCWSIPHNKKEERWAYGCV